MSMPIPLLIKGGMIVNADRSWRADVLCVNGKIVAVGEDLDDQAPPGTQLLDATGQYVMPGGIDPHTYLATSLREPAAADDFFDGTAAALAGGTTTVLDTIHPLPGQTLMEAYDEHRRQAKRAVCSYGFHATITHWDKQMQRDVAALTKEGINSFSHYMGYDELLMCDDAVLMQSFACLLELGVMPIVHAENGVLARQLQRTLFSKGLRSPSCYPLAHPAAIEGEATQRAITIAELAGVPLYLANVSCQASIEAIGRAHERGLRVYGEAPVANLMLSSKVYENTDQIKAALHIKAPPFRDLDDQRALWKASGQGWLHTLGSHHQPFHREDKTRHLDAFDHVPVGCGALEERMALCWHAGINSGRLTPSQFVALTSTRAARLFHLYPHKGVICQGADADIVLWDPEAHHSWSAVTHHSRSDNSLYEGLTTKGMASVTVCGGHVVWQGGQLRVTRGMGAWLPRAPFAPQCAVARAFHRRHTQL